MVVGFVGVDARGVGGLAVLGGDGRIIEPAGDVTAAHRQIDRMLDFAAPSITKLSSTTPPSLPVSGTMGRQPGCGQVTMVTLSLGKSAVGCP
jgi:hypothetical protein